MAVEDDRDAERLDTWLFKKCDFIPSRSFAAALIKNGNVHVQRIGSQKIADSIPKPSLRLRVGDKIRVTICEVPDHENPKAENIPLTVLHEDEHILVIDKPAGLVVHPGAGVPAGTLVNAVLFHCGSSLPSLGNPNRAGIVHRLDRDTSGVMVVGKTQLALTKLSQSFAKHEQIRRYHAICYSELPQSEVRIETGYGRDPRSRLRFASFPFGTGKRACTRARTLATFLHGAASLIECELETGRTHQIRVHLTSLKCPIMGDPVYGSPMQNLQIHFQKFFTYLNNQVTRQMLHAVLLGFKHPATSEYIEFRSTYPQDMKLLLERIEQESQTLDLK